VFEGEADKVALSETVALADCDGDVEVDGVSELLALKVEVTETVGVMLGVTVYEADTAALGVVLPVVGVE
jgi:hypothetical protein